ncbi:MAG: metal-dependent transcriptional regulator [Chitinophagaceae bacterium]
MLTSTEENYLKAIYHLSEKNKFKEKIGTNMLAEHLHVKPASANAMLKKLMAKQLVHYEKYGKTILSKEGKKVAIHIIRNHRLWETFLCGKLDFTWDEVHDIAEQLEHIKSDKLIDRLEAYLKYPLYDPHGDPIPSKTGSIPVQKAALLSDAHIGEQYKINAVKDTSILFLKHLQKLHINIGTIIRLEEKIEFDHSVVIRINKSECTLSYKFASCLVVEKI